MGIKQRCRFNCDPLIDQANAKKFELKYFIDQYKKSLGGALPQTASALGRFVEGDVSQYDPENADLQMYEEAQKADQLNKDIKEHVKEVAKKQKEEMNKQAKEQDAVDRSSDPKK